MQEKSNEGLGEEHKEQKRTEQDTRELGRKHTRRGSSEKEKHPQWETMDTLTVALGATLAGKRTRKRGGRKEQKEEEEGARRSVSYKYKEEPQSVPPVPDRDISEERIRRRRGRPCTGYTRQLSRCNQKTHGECPCDRTRAEEQRQGKFEGEEKGRHEKETERGRQGSTSRGRYLGRRKRREGQRKKEEGQENRRREYKIKEIYRKSGTARRNKRGGRKGVIGEEKRKKRTGSRTRKEMKERRRSRRKELVLPHNTLIRRWKNPIEEETYRQKRGRTGESQERI